MSLLTQELPLTVMVCGSVYPVRTDFRSVLAIYEELDVQKGAREVHALRALTRFYATRLPPNYAEAAQALRDFLIPSGEQIGSTGEGGGQKAARRAPDFCFTQDAPLIYAAFLEQYGMDLLRVEHLHWHAFLALFAALSPSTRFGEIRACRAQPITADMPAARRAYLADMKRMFALRRGADLDTEALTRALLHGGDLSEFTLETERRNQAYGTGRKY